MSLPADQPRGAVAGRRPREPWCTRAELALGGWIVGALAVAGAMAGLVWEAISPARPVGYVAGPDAIIPDETESFIASDGRFAIICAVVGAAAAVAVWLRPHWRGPVSAAALAVGGFVGAIVADVVGQAIGGGHDDGPVNTVIAHLPLQVHARGLLLVEPLLAVWVYVLLALFANRDDLGRRRAAQHATE